MAAKSPSEIWRDFETDGVPASGTHKPLKADIREWAEALESQVALGLKWLPSVRIATNSPVTLASHLENGDTVDGVVLATNDRILVKNQAAPAANGIYVVQASGTPVRATDADAVAELIGATVAVLEGTANAGTAWTCNNTAANLVTLGTDAVSFAQLPGLSFTLDDDGVTTDKIADEAVTLPKMAHVATNTFLGRDTAGTGAVEVMSATAARGILNVEDGADVTDAANVTAAGAFMKSADDTDDITVGATNKFATAAEKAKLAHISVTQPVDLDTMESGIATNATAISTEATTRGAADTALTASVVALGASINTHANALYAADVVLTAADAAQTLALNRRFDGDPKRPGDSPLSFIESIAGGDPTAIAPLTSADTASGVDGQGVILTAASPLLAQRKLTAMESGREYRVRYAVRRTVNSPDPNNDAVLVVVAWYDQNKIALTGGSAATTIANLTTLATGSGLATGARILGLASGGNVQTVAPAGAVYFRAYIYQYGDTPQTAAVILDSVDTTDLVVASPDLSSVTSRITALETIDAGDRLDALESAVGTPSMLRFDVLGNALAATDIPVGVGLIEVMAFAEPGDGWHRFLKRAPSEPTRQQKWQIDGAWWESTAQALVIFMNAQSNGGDDPSYEPENLPLNLWEWDFYAQDDASTVVGTEFERPDGSYSNIAIGFGAKLARARPECDVYIVGFAKGGITIDCWQGTGSYDMIEAIEGNMPVALELAGAEIVFVHQWWQGDGQSALATWSTDYNGIEDAFRAYAWFPASTPTIMHAPSPYNATAKPMMKKILATVGDRPGTRSFVDSTALAIDYWDAVGDYIHATGEGRHLLGEMAYNVFEGHARHGIVPGVTVDPDTKNMAFGHTSDGIPTLPVAGISYQFRNDVDGASNILNLQNAFTTANSAVILKMVTDHSDFQMSVASAATFTTFRSFWGGPTAYWIGATNAAGTIIFSAGGFGIRWAMDASGNFNQDQFNTVISASRHHMLRSYTVGTLPAAGTAGGQIYVSNETGGAVPAFSDGTNWRRVTDRTIVA